MSQKLTVLCFPASGQEIPKEPLKATIELVVSNPTENSQFAAPRSKEGDIRIKTAILTSSKSPEQMKRNSQNTVANTSKRIPTMMEEEEDDEEPKGSVNTGILVEAFPFTELKELKTRCLSIQFEDSSVLGNKHFLIPLASISDNLPTYLKTETQEWDGLFTAEKKLLVVRFRFPSKTSSNPVELTEDSMQQELKYMYKVKDQYPEHLQLILMKVDDLAFRDEDSSSGDNRLIITKDEVTRLRLQTFDADSTELPLDSDRSLDDLPKYSDLRAKLKVLFQDINSVKVFTDIKVGKEMKQSEILRHCETIRQTLTDLMKNTPAVRDRLFIVHYVGVEFFKKDFRTIGASYSLLTSFKKNERLLTMSEKASIWMSHVLGFGNHLGPALLDQIVRSSSSLKMSDLCFIEATPTGTRLEDIFGYYEDKNEIECPILNFIIKNLVNSSTSGYFTNDSEDMTPAFRDLSNLVFSRCCQETRDLLWEKLLYRDMHPGLESIEASMISESQLAPEDLNMAVVYYCCLQETESQLSSAFYQYLRTHFRQVGTTIFEILYHIASEGMTSKQEELGQNLDNFLFGRFRQKEDQDVFAYFKQLFTEKVQREESLNLAAYIFKNEEIFSMQEKRRLFEDLASSTLTHPKSFALKVLKKLIERNQSFVSLIIPETLLGPDGALLILEDCLRPAVEIWKKEGNLNNSKKETVIYFAENCKNSKENAKIASICYFLADLYLGSPQMAANISKLSSSFFVQVFLSVSEFIQKETSISNMLISTIDSLVELKEKLECLEKFEKIDPNKEISLSRRVESASEKEKILAKSMELIQDSIQIIAEADSRIGRQPFVEKAQQAIGRLKNNYKSYTVSGVESSTEYLDLVILTQSHFSIFKALKDREPFIGLLTKNEASSCRGFIKNIAEAKVVLREDLHKLAFDSKKLTVGLTEVYFPDISVENGEHCRRMLAGLELDDQSTKTLINRSKELRAGKHLLQIIQESKIDEKNETSLERLVQLQAFNNSKKESFEIIKGIVALKQAFFRRFPVQSAIDEVEYHFFEAHDKIQLRNFDCFLDIDIKRLDEFSRMHRLIEFLLKDIKEEKLMKKLKDDLNTNKWDLLDKLKKSYSDLKFLLTPKDSSQALLIDCLKRCTARSTKEQDDLLALITYMRKNLSDFEHEQRKAMGDFTDIVQSLMANSLFILEHDSETNSFLLAAKELEKENFKTPEDFEKGGLESFKENEEFGGNFYKVGSFFNAEELHDHRAKARILKEQMGHLTEDKTQSQKLEKVIGLVEITDSLEAIQASLIQLFLIGLVSKNFQSPLINNLIQKNSNSRFMKVIDKNSKLVFHIKDAKCSILTTIKEELQAKANQATEEYLGLINMNENHLLTYFTQEKMDILIRCLDSDVSTWYQDENRGLIEILKESLDIPDSELSVAVKKTNFKGGKIVEKVYHIHKKDEQKGESRTFECIVGCLREFSQYRAKGQDNKDIFGLDKKVSYIDVEAHLNQYEFLLLLIRQQNKHASKWSYVSQILYCDETVSHVELLAFLNRCFRDDLRRIYAVLNPAGLPHHLLKVLTDFVENNNKEDMRVNRRLVIFNNLSSSEAFQNQDHFNHIRLKSIQDSAFLDKSVLFGAYQEKLQAIKVVSSDRPGDGKTSWIRDQHDHDKKANRSRLILELGLTGEVNKRYIEQLFLGLEKGIPKGSDKEGNSRTNKFDIHIKIDYIDCFIENKGLIDYFLFSVCFMGKFGVKGKLIDIGDLVNKVYIEIGNSIKHLLVGSTQRHLDIVSLLYDLKSSVDKGKSLIVPLPAFSKEGIKYDPNPDSPMQLAAFYLSVKEQFLSGLHSGSVIDCCKNQHQAVPRDQYQRLLYTYFQQANKKSPETYYNFQFWIRVLNQQASRTLEWLSKLQEEEPVSASNPLVKSVGLEDLAKELFLESVESSNSIIGLHSAQAREKQAIAKIIFDLHARRDHLSKSSMQRDVQEIADIDRRIEDEENKLRKKVLEEEEMSDSWNTDNIFFTLISGTSFLPVIGSLDHFNKRTVENLELATVKQDKQKGDQKTKKEDSYLIKGISISTKRYIAYLREQFAGKLSDFDSSRRFNLGHSDEHLWYVFCLAQLAFLTSNLPGTTSHKDKISKSFAKIRESAQNFDEGKGFVLTKQTYMKLCLMMLKADLRTPIIIMGESGCGKTYLSQFLVKELCQDKLKMVSLYSGFDEQELIYEILEATSEAEELKADKGKPNKKLWIFFDEFNTTTLQGLIADIMIDRTVPSYYFKQQKYLKRDPSDKTKAAFPEKALYNSLEGESLKLPDNICFIACCNPFLIKLKKNSEENIGLVPNEKTSHLSHIVHPLPDRILALVWDFGQLPEEEEKSHILNMVKAAKLFSLNRPGMTTAKVVQYNERMAGFIHRAHKAVREIEERSGVSLRDINRVFLFFKWFQSQMPLLRDYHAWVTSEDNRALKNCGRIRLRNTWIFESEDSQEVASAICSIIICYSLKLNGQQENQKKLFDIIHNWAKHAIGVISLTRSEALSCLNTIAEIYLHQIKDKFIEENIALNNPLKENFMTLLACYAVRVPLIIVGAPGTSKTLCTSILKKIVGPAKNDPSMTLFRNLETGTWLDYCGSEATTPTIITRIFEKVKSWYQDYEKTKKKGSSSDSNSDKTDLPGIFFDELGHAEKSPHNPLKVMHSHLENFLGKIPFISISNWRPDQSKVNRMVCLSRPDLTKLDLLDIFSSTFKEIKSSQTVESFVREAFDKMSQCYLNYREWQRHTSPNKMYHRDFHGSRDIYAMIKFIILELKKLVLKTEKDIQDMEITTQLQQSLTESAIEESDVCKKKVYFRVFFLDVLNIFKDAIERNLNGEIYKFGDDPEAKAAFPELISPEFLKRVKRTELIRDDFYSNYVEEFARDKTVHETLDEFLEINFLKTRESARFNKDKMFSLTSSEVFKIFFMNQICSKVSIDQNFSKEIIDNNFMIWPILTPNFERFDRTCIKKFLKDNEDVMRTLRQNIETTLEKGVDCRFIAIRTEGTIMDDFLVNNLGICLRRIEEEKRKELKTKGIKNGKLNVCKGIIDLRVSGNCGKLEDILSQLKTYITEGYLVVMKNLDHIYPGLYELFNQKDENCSLYYGLTPQKVTVHPNFKCVVILPTGSNIRRNNQIEKIQPAPFLNRFEKYYYGISSVLKYGKMEKIQRIMTQAKQIMKENPSFLLGFSIDSLITISISDSEHFSSKKETRSGKSEEKGSNKDSLDSLIEQRFYRLMTANYLVSNSSMKVKEIKTFKKAHKGKLFGQLLGGNAQKSSLQPINPVKHFVFTFTGLKRLKEIVETSSATDSWIVLDGKDIATSGGFRMAKKFSSLVEESDKTLQKQKLIVSFESPSDFDIIRQLKSQIDQRNLGQEGIRAFTDVIFALHVSRDPKNRRFLERSLGISYSQGWDLVVIDNLDPSFSYDFVFGIKNKTIENVILDDCLPDSRFGDEDSSEIEKCKDDGEHRIGETVLRRVLTSIIETLIYQLKGAQVPKNSVSKNRRAHYRHEDLAKGCKFDKLKEWFSPKLNSSSKHPSSQLMFSKLAGLIKSRLKSTDMGDLKVTQALERMLKGTESYSDIELHLGQLFYDSHRNEIADILWTLNSQCRSLPSLIFGLELIINDEKRETQQQELMIADYFAVLDNAIQIMLDSKSSDELKIPLSEPRAFYMPFSFRQAFSHAKADFKKEIKRLYRDCASMGELADNAKKLFIRTISLDDGSNKTNILDDGTRKRKSGVIAHLRQHEFWITKLVTKIFSERIEPLVLNFNIDLLDGNDSTLRNMLVVDWLNSIEYATFADDYSIETMKEFVTVCFELSKVIKGDEIQEMEDEDFKKDQTDFTKGLATATIITSFFDDIARSLLDLIESSKGKALELIKMDTRKKNTMVNYMSLFDLEAKMRNEAMCASIDLQQVTKQQIARLSTSAELQKGPGSAILSVLYGMISVAGDDSYKRLFDELRHKMMQDSTNSSCHSTLKSSVHLIHAVLVQLKECRQRLVGRQSSGSSVTSTDQRSLRKEVARYLDKIHAFVAVWMEELKNLDILKDANVTRFLEDRSFITEEEYRKIILKAVKKASEWASKVFRVDKDRIESRPSLVDIQNIQLSLKDTDEKDTDEKDKDKKNKDKNDADMELPSLDSFIRRAFSERSLNFAVFSLLESICRRMSKWDQKIGFDDLLEQATEVFQNTHQTPNLAYLLAIAVMRTYFNDERLRNLSAKVDKPFIEEVICKDVLASQENCLDALFKPENYPCVFFLQRVHRSSSITSLEATAASGYRVMEKLVEVLPNKYQTSQITFSNESMRVALLGMKANFSKILEEYQLQEAAKKTSAIKQLITFIQEPSLGSTDTSLFFLGVSILTTIISDPQTQEGRETAESERKTINSLFKDAMAKDLRPKVAHFYQLIVNLTEDDGAWLSGNLFKDGRLENCGPQAKTAMAIFGLLVACFDQMRYKPDSSTKWMSASSTAKSISTEDFRCLYGLSKHTKNGMEAFEDRVCNRLHDPDYLRPSGRLPANMGIYQCACGFIACLNGTGYLEAPLNCPWERAPMRQQKQIKDLDELANYIKRESENATKVYAPHAVLNPSSLVFRLAGLQRLGSQQLTSYLLDGSQDKAFKSMQVDLYISHLFDHMFLASQRLFLPREKWENWETDTSGIIKLQKNEALKAKQIGTSQEYWMMHIENDLLQLAGLLHLEQKENVLEWLQIVLTGMGEMIIEKKPEDPSTKLHIDRNKYLPSDQNSDQAYQAVCTHQDQILQMADVSPPAKAVMSLVSLHLKNVPQTMASQEHLLLMSKLFRVNPASTNDSEYLARLRELMKEPQLKIIENVDKYQDLLFELPDLITPIVEMCRLVHHEFSGKITVEEARSSFILGSSLCENKTTLQGLFKRFKENAAQIDKLYKEPMYADLFSDISKELFEQAIGQLTSDQTTTVQDFILVFGPEEKPSQKFLKAMIRLFINKLHNKFSLLSLGQIEECEALDDNIDQKIQSGGVLSIKNSTYADYVYLLKDFDLGKLAEDHANLDLGTDTELAIDTRAIKQELGRLLYKPQIKTEQGDFEEFVYCDRVSMSGISREIRRYFNYASADDIDKSKVLIKNSQELRANARSKGQLKNWIDIISNTCRYLNSGLKFASFGQPLLEVINDCSHESETKIRLVPSLKDLFEQLQIDEEMMTVGDLKPLFKELKAISYDAYVLKECHTPLEGQGTAALKLIQELREKGKRDLKCIQLNNTVKDQVFEYIMGGYPLESHLKKTISEEGVNLTLIKDSIESTSDPKEKEFQKSYLAKVEQLLSIIRYEHWGIVQGYFKDDQRK